MNNLDRRWRAPDDLVVYGGIGRAARNWTATRASCAPCASWRRRNVARAVGQARRRVRTHTDAPRVLIANSNLVGAGPRGPLPRARSQGPDDVRPDDGRVVDLHWQPGDRAGHVRDLRGDGRQHYGGDLAGAGSSTAGLGGMGGAQPLAATMAGASMLAWSCRPERIQKRLTRATRRARGHRRRGPRADRARDARAQGDLVACSAMPRKCCRAVEACVRPMPSPTRPRARPGERLTCPRAGHSSSGTALRESDRAPSRPLHAVRWPARRAMLAFQKLGIPVFDYATTSARSRWTRREDAFAFPASCPPTCGRCSAAASDRPLGRAVGDPEDIPSHRQKVKALIPTTRTSTAGWTWRANASSSRACPHASAGWPGSATGSPRVQRNGRARRVEGSCRDRRDTSTRAPSRSPNARRRRCVTLRRRRRLADAQRDAEHRERCDGGSIHHGGGVGIGYRQHAGVVIGVRRHPAAGEAHRARAVERPSLGRDAPRRCGYEIAVECAREHGLEAAVPGLKRGWGSGMGIERRAAGSGYDSCAATFRVATGQEVAAIRLSPSPIPIPCVPLPHCRIAPATTRACFDTDDRRARRRDRLGGPEAGCPPVCGRITRRTGGRWLTPDSSTATRTSCSGPARGGIRTPHGWHQFADIAREVRDHEHRACDARRERGRARRAEPTSPAVAARRSVTTVEIKSGYGLGSTQKRACCALRDARGAAPGHVSTSLLAAHALPPNSPARG